MPYEMDLTFLDHPEIMEVVFPIVYAPFHLLDYPRFSPDMPIYSIEVEDGIRIDCGFWVKGKEYPSILYFHGNGETVADYNYIAPFYTQRGINLFVADYRGYGSSNGKPTVANMLGDALTIFRNFSKR